MNLELSIPSDDPVRLVSAFVKEMDLSELYKTYDRIRKNQASPRQMLKVVLYAAMNRIYSSRDIRKACKRDINFMYLLEGMSAPDHATIARFISLHFSLCSKELLMSKESQVAAQVRLKQWTLVVQDCMNRPKDMTVDELCEQQECFYVARTLLMMTRAKSLNIVEVKNGQNVPLE